MTDDSTERRKRILIGVSGGIAAYKAADITGVLVKIGYEIKVIMTENAKKFITPLTLATLSKNPVYDDSVEWIADGTIKHIELSKWADIFVIVPATANTISKIVTGITDNLLTSVYLAMHSSTNKLENCRGIVICPAMNTHMWEKQWIQDHISVLSKRFRHLVVSPVEGLLACGDTGMGKLASRSQIIDKIQGHFGIFQ